MGKILLTGAGGFIGGNLLSYIKETTPSSLKDIICLSSRAQKGVETIIYKEDNHGFTFDLPSGIDAVIHLGAWTPKTGSRSQNWPQSNSNILFLDRLLRQLHSEVKRFVFASTLDVYGNIGLSIDENTPINPVSLYGWSKLYGEKMLESWSKEHGATLQLLRLGHIYGPGEEQYGKMIPIFIKRILKNEPLVIFSSGQEKRSFLHVRDCVRCIWEAYKKDVSHGITNIVSDRSHSVEEIARMLIHISGKKAELLIENRPVEVHDCIFNATKMKNLFGPEKQELYTGLQDEYYYFLERYTG